MPFLPKKKKNSSALQKRWPICCSAIFLWASTLLAQQNISDVLANTQPYLLYVNAYGSFQFESNSSLGMGSDTDAQTFEGHTLLKRNEHGNLMYVREPLMGAPQIELRLVDGKTSIRMKSGGPFNRVRYQKEFDRWLNGAFVEIFLLYQKAGFNEPGQGAVKGTSVCYQKKEASLCVDPSTGLPLQGALMIPQKDKPPIRVEFKVEVFAPNVVSIPEP